MWNPSVGEWMFGSLVIAYLFCGGTGAGTLALTAAFWLRLRRSDDVRFEGGVALMRRADPRWHVLARSCAAGLVLLAFGIACLMADIGRDDRVLNLFLMPHATYLTVGGFALLLLMGVGAGMTVAGFLDLPALGRMEAPLAWAAIALGGVVAVYTGLLLSSMGSVALWANPLLPALFAASSLSCGCALLALAAFASDAGRRLEGMMRVVARVDAVAVAVEAACAFGYAACSMTSPRQAAVESARALFGGAVPEFTALWWSFVIAGLAVPLAAELVLARRGVRDSARLLTACALVGTLVLAGSVSMRAGVVMAGDHPVVTLVQGGEHGAVAPALPAQGSD